MDLQKKFDVDFSNGKLELGIDSNADGQKLVTIKVNLTEAIQELFYRKSKIESANLVGFEFDFQKISLSLDSDQDGEKLLDIEIDLSEALDEAGFGGNDV